MTENSSTNRTMQKVPIKLIIGIVIAGASFLSIDYVTGGILTGGEPSTKLLMEASIISDPSSEATDKISFATKISLRDKQNIQLTFVLYDKILELYKRRQLVASAQKVKLWFSFVPISISLPNSEENIAPLIAKKQCGPSYKYCVEVDKSALNNFRGGLVIQTGLGLSKLSLSSYGLKIGVLSRQPGTDIDVSLDLPKDWFPSNVLPSPTHAASFVSRRLYWEGNDRYGKDMPLPNSGNRAIAENLGIDLEIENPRLKAIETTLLFFLSAIFGAGFALITEWIFSKAMKSRLTDSSH